MVLLYQKPLGDDIEHIIVLMFENRSFDNVFGSLYSEEEKTKYGIEFDGLNRDEWNAIKPTPPVPEDKRIYVWTDATGKNAGTTPYPDPGESFEDMTEQILDPEATGADPMSGFVANYVKQKAGVPNGPRPNQRAIMHYFNDCHMPVSRGFARRFAVSDQYFASGPTQTLPNRAFSMCGSPGTNDGKARLNNNDFKNLIEPGPFGSLNLKSIFELLDDEFPDSSHQHHSPNKALNWKVYYHDSSLSMISSYLDSLGDKGPNITNFDTSDYGTGHLFIAKFT